MLGSFQVRSDPIYRVRCPRVGFSRPHECGHDKLQPNGHAAFGQEAFGFGDRVFAVMEDAGGKRGAGLADGDRFKEMLRAAGSAAGNDGNLDGIGDGAGDLDVVAVLRAVGVH